MQSLAKMKPMINVFLEGEEPQQLFEMFSQVALVRVCWDLAAGRSLDYGYVNYNSPRDAARWLGSEYLSYMSQVRWLVKREKEEAENDESHREREKAEMKKQLRKQQKEVERDQRRREKEEAELKKKLSIQKQASAIRI